jgi:EmrB/QacA subfamily drug resistance transporter
LFGHGVAATLGVMNPIASTESGAPWAALPVLLVGAFMVVLDFFIVNVALPSIATDLGAGDSSLEWVVAGYGLTFAVFLITAGRLGDDLGRRRVYVAGLVLFTVTSAACGLAPSPGTLVAARVAQGIAGAVLMPQVLAIIGVTFRGPDYARALGFYGVALGVAAVGGQLIGGALVETDVAGLGWRSCFLINVPLGLAALALAPRLVPESRAEKRARLDVVGAAVVALGLTAILLPLIEGRSLGWPAWTWISLALAPAFLAAFVRRQRRLSERGGNPLLELALFRERGFSAGIVAQLFLASAQAAFFVYLALYLQLGRGLDALESGLVFTIIAVAYVAVSGPAPGLVERFGRALIAAGGLSLTLGLVLLALAVAEVGTGGSLLWFVPGLLLAGAGIGLCFTPLTSTVLAGVHPSRAGGASGAMSTMQQMGYALGVAVTGVIFFGASDNGIGHAFEQSLIQLAIASAGVVVASRLLPRPTPAAGTNAPRPAPAQA